MKRVPLGRTGIEVTRLGIGTLTMSPMQGHLSVAAGAAVITRGLELGIRLIDTAEMYGSMPQVCAALATWRGDPVVVASKSAAATAEGINRAIDEALTALRRPRIDIFLLHAVRDAADLVRRQPALDALLERRRRGEVGAVGASSHSVAMIGQLADDPRFEVLHPICNRDGIGVLGGSLDELLSALARARLRGAGVYAMKPLGGGHLRHDVAGALRWLWGRTDAIDALTLGMASPDEAEVAAAIEAERPIDPALQRRIEATQRHIYINPALCRACGQCIEACEHGAMLLEDRRAVNQSERCLVCGYCLPRCPNFAIRLIGTGSDPEPMA